MRILPIELLTCILNVVAILAINSNKILPEDLTFKLSGSDLRFPCPSTKSIYASTGRYIAKNIIATRLQIFGNKAIVTLPRFRSGVPFSLAKFDLNEQKAGKVQLEPYPCWSVQEEGNCEAIQNAIDLVVDLSDRLWVLDLGICNTLERPVKRCAPKIWIFNLESGEIAKTINLEQFVTKESHLQYLLVDYSPEGAPFAYISDAGTGTIIVINVATESGYRVILPEVVSANSLSKSVLYLQLAHKPSGNVLYFSYLTSPRLFSIKSAHLQTGQTADAVVDVGGKPNGTQMVLLGTDNGSGIFFRYKGQSDIYFWNSDDDFEMDNFVLAQNGGDCRLTTQVAPGWKELMWAIESNFHDYITNSTGCLGATVAVYPLVKDSS